MTSFTIWPSGVWDYNDNICYNPALGIYGIYFVGLLDYDPVHGVFIYVFIQFFILYHQHSINWMCRLPTHFFPGDEVTTTHFGWGPFLVQNSQLTKPKNLKPFQTWLGCLVVSLLCHYIKSFYSLWVAVRCTLAHLAPFLTTLLCHLSAYI